MEKRLSLLKQNAAYLQEFLAITEHIGSCLNNDGHIDELYPQMMEDVEKRGILIRKMSKIAEALKVSQSGEAAEQENKQEWLCREMLKQIDEIETKNKNSMQDTIERYKRKMRANKQSRETLGAYNRQMNEPEGTLLNKLR